jgi:cytochrome P450
LERKLRNTTGPIIRITPTELHIDDPVYHETLYSRAGRRDRYSYFSGRFGYASDSFSTSSHDLHRLRRKAMAPMFSVQKIDDFQPVIRKKVEKLCQKIATYQDGQVLRLSRAWMALTTDIITEYAFARSYDQLDSPNFQDTLHEALVAIYTVGHFALHFPIVFPILDIMPDWLVRKAQPEVLPVVGMRKDLARQVQELRKGVYEDHKHAKHITIFQELLNSDLPEEEKSNARLGDEAQLIIAAGLITTSWTLSVASFHIINNPNIYRKLREELRAAGVSSTSTLDWHKLEQLPYLNGCVHEGVRLAHGISTRSPRLAPDIELKYGEWVIPKNTPVSMTAVDILMNEKIFPDPKTFLPERWIGRPELDRYFVPFGKGSRACAGIK